MSANCVQKRVNFADSQKPDRFERGHQKPLMGKGWSLVFLKKRNDVHVRKWQKRSKMTFLDQNPILRACPTRAPGHRVACTLLPFTVLKHTSTVIAANDERCMHPLTVYGIETKIACNFTTTIVVACTLLPFTVLKRTPCVPSKTNPSVACTLLPFTVLKQIGSTIGTSIGFVACTLLPFTVLKPRHLSQKPDRSVACTLLPFTVLKHFRRNLLGRHDMLHAPSYRLRY